MWYFGKRLYKLLRLKHKDGVLTQYAICLLRKELAVLGDAHLCSFYSGQGGTRNEFKVNMCYIATRERKRKGEGRRKWEQIRTQKLAICQIH